MDSSSEDDDYVLETNPLLIDIIIKRLMDFLSLKNVKNCRLVCHKWNCFAEPVLKKRGKIVFTNSFRPSDFMALFSQPHHLAQPFTAFSLVAGDRYFEYDEQDERWTISEINELFTKWGKYIKKLDLSLYQVWLNRDDRFNIRALNIDHLFESMGSNLEDLVFVGSVGGSSGVEVSLKMLSSVKNISLNRCYIKLDSFEKRLTPLKFKLVDVIFRRSRKTQPNTIINDLVDFSRCSDIDLRMEWRKALCGAVLTTITFDFSRDVVSSNKIKFDRIVPLNVKKSKTEPDRLTICRYPTEAVQLHLKELELRRCKIDLTLISGTVEKLTITKCSVVSFDIHPLDLPNLKCLSLTPYSFGRYASTVYKIFSLFVNCENLSDLELTRLPLGKDYDAYSDFRDDRDYDYVEPELDIHCLPKSVKVLKLRNNSRGLKFAGSKNAPMEVDVLILDVEDGGDGDCENRLFIKEVLERIKTKVLIRAVFRHESWFRDEPKETVSQFLANIVQDEKLEKTIVELKHGPHILKVLESVDQSKSCKNSADKNSPTYHEFVGKFLVTDEQKESERF